MEGLALCQFRSIVNLPIVRLFGNHIRSGICVRSGKGRGARFRNGVTIVPQASRGTGASSAQHLALKGESVILADVRQEAARQRHLLSEEVGIRRLRFPSPTAWATYP